MIKLSQFLILLALLLSVVSCSQSVENSSVEDSGDERPSVEIPEVPEHSATIAKSRSDRWAKKHGRQVREAVQKQVELLFLGDSITNRWSMEGAKVWAEFYGYRKAYNLGSGGDRTEHTLWRIEQGGIERLQPKVLVLMIGTNNLVEKGESMPNTPREIADGVTAIVRGLRSKMPNTDIVLHAIFPRGKRTAHRLRQQVVQTNPLLVELADDPRVHFLDISDAFVDDQGKIPKQIMPDALHLSAQGYRRWAESIEETVSKLLAESG